MDKKLKNTLKYLLWTGVAVALLYFSFRGVNWKDFGTALKSCRWGFVLLSILLGALAIFIRSLRWRMQLLPVDPSTSRITCWNAYSICMIVNLVLPRVGEVARCGYVTKHSARDGEGRRLASLDKVIGTVVIDRIWDILSIVVILLLLLAVLWDRFGTFFTENIFAGVAVKARLWWVLVLAALLAGGFVFLCWKLRDRGRIWGRVWKVIQGMADGLSSCLHMKHGWLFILFTALIWGCYWLMSACIMWSLQGIDPSGMSPDLADALARIDSLGMSDALFLMFAGALSSLVPVPGGFGAFHGAVALTLSSVYGVPFAAGLIFATLSHESQVIVGILCGGESYIHETFFRR